VNATNSCETSFPFLRVQINRVLARRIEITLPVLSDEAWSYRDFGKSTAGFLAKKSNGRSSNSCHAAGMIGQSSGRGT
jgi:hypothetical protein